MKFLITGATGGIGGGVLAHLAKKIPKSDFAASSSRSDAVKQFTDSGFQFRFADYNDKESLVKAFAGVEKLLFVSSNTFDNEKRTKQHSNVVEAAKEAGVGHTYYTSLAFGGYGSDSKVDVQQAHLATEALLKASGIKYTSIREGFYSEAFPLFIDWAPSSKTIRLPNDGPMACASRAELAEATAELMLRNEIEFKNNIALLTGPKAYTLTEVARMINEFTGRNLDIRRVSREEYVTETVKSSGKPERFVKSRISWFDGVAVGDGKTIDPLIAQLIGRVPKDMRQVMKELLEANPDYEWHQNSNPIRY